MSNRTRREFLITTGSGVAAGLLAHTAGYAQYKPDGAAALRIRKNVAGVAAKSDLASLNKGVAAMRALVNSDPSDPRGWILQAFIHGNCGGFTKCQHGNWFFPPWHRSFLYYFEALIQHFSGDNNFALPYWDWSRTHSVPGSFYGSGNPLDDILSIRGPQCPSAPPPGRGRGPTAQFTQQDLDTFVGPVVINRIQQNPDYATYGGRANGGGELEGTPHNFVHRWVGGPIGSNMVRAYSPLDPIFWMHHCNVDRLYSNWLSRPNHNPPPDTTWKQKSFNDFFDKDKNPVGSKFTCEMTLDSRVMNYIYDEAMEIPPPLTENITKAREAAKAAKPAELVATVTAGRVTKGKGVITYVSEAAPPPEARRVMNAAALGADEYVVRLAIEGIKLPARQNTGVHVFLGPGITANTPITAPGYVGSFTFFDGDGDGGEHKHDARNRLLNASEALKRLYGDTSVPEAAGVAVSLVTRPLYTGVKAFATVEEIQPDRVQLEVVRLSS